MWIESPMEHYTEDSLRHHWCSYWIVKIRWDCTNTLFDLSTCFIQQVVVQSSYAGRTGSGEGIWNWFVSILTLFFNNIISSTKDQPNFNSKVLWDVLHCIHSVVLLLANVNNLDMIFCWCLVKLVREQHMTCKEHETTCLVVLTSMMYLENGRFMNL